MYYSKLSRDNTLNNHNFTNLKLGIKDFRVNYDKTINRSSNSLFTRTSVIMNDSIKNTKRSRDY